jgi:hypothetical protein
MRLGLFYTVADFSRMDLLGTMWNISPHFIWMGDLTTQAQIEFLAHINHKTGETDKHD